MSSLKLSGHFRTAMVFSSSLFIPFLMHRYFVAQIQFLLVLMLLSLLKDLSKTIYLIELINIVGYTLISVIDCNFVFICFVRLAHVSMGSI